MCYGSSEWRKDSWGGGGGGEGVGNEAAMKAGFKEKLALEVHQDKDVLFWWSNLCDVTNVDSECSKALLLTIML